MYFSSDGSSALLLVLPGQDTRSGLWVGMQSGICSTGTEGTNPHKLEQREAVHWLQRAEEFVLQSSIYLQGKEKTPQAWNTDLFSLTANLIFGVRCIHDGVFDPPSSGISKAENSLSHQTWESCSCTSCLGHCEEQQGISCSLFSKHWKYGAPLFLINHNYFSFFHLWATHFFHAKLPHPSDNAWSLNWEGTEVMGKKEGMKERGGREGGEEMNTKINSFSSSHLSQKKSSQLYERHIEKKSVNSWTCSYYLGDKLHFFQNVPKCIHFQSTLLS